MDRPIIHISFSHNDQSWVGRLEKHLEAALGGPYESEIFLSPIEKGFKDKEWRELLLGVIERASVAILLISQNFLKSDFVRQVEAPALLQRRLSDRPFLLVPIIVEPCQWQEVDWLAPLSVRPHNARPLSLFSPEDQDGVLAQISQEIVGVGRLISRIPENPPVGLAPEEQLETKASMESSSGPVPPLDLHTLTDQQMMTEGASECVRAATKFLLESQREPTDSVALLAGCALHGAAIEGLDFYAPSFLATTLRQRRNTEDLIAALDLADREDLESLPAPSEDSANRDIAFVFNLAQRISQDTCQDPRIHARHLIAALLVEGTEPVPKSAAHLRSLGIDVAEIREEFLAQIRDHVAEDNLEAWEDWLGSPGREAQSRPVPGYIPDTEAGKDQLGIESEVNALCAVAMAGEFTPPLSIGLFGDWGSGKSFFMRMMRDRVRLLEACAREAEKNQEPTAYCSHVVQITFNAWHYIDADLWASLVTKIWEDLSLFVAETHPDPQTGTRALREELKQGNDRLAEMERVVRETEAKGSDLQERITDLERRREQKAEELGKMLPGVVARFVVQDPNVREQLGRAAERIGLPAAAAATSETVQTVTSLTGQLRTLVRWVREKTTWGQRLFFLAAPPVVAMIVGIAIYAALHGEAFQKIWAGLGFLATLIVQAATWMKPWLQKIAGAFSQLEKAKHEIDRAAEKRKAEISDQEKALREELESLRRSEATLKDQLAKEKERLLKVEEEIQKKEGPRDIGEFVHAQASSHEYQSRLGFIARVRRDFDRLSQLMTGDGAASRNPDLPRIDRIVLYVDDLDRCPGDRVVKVLEAVHLLLAMPLFVVVVGVDPRWLLRSLEEHYSEFLGAKESHAGFLDEDEVSDWASTPLHYLEKIFQIPFTLQPMRREGFTRLVRSMVPVQVAAGSAVPPPESAAAPAPAPADGGEAAPAPAAPEPTEPQDTVSVPPSIAIPTRPRAPRLDPRPPALEIDPLEVAFMGLLAPLIVSPRSAKRLVNIYRLIRAQLDERALDHFVGESEAPGEHQAVLVLLAVLIGYPDQASSLFRHLQGQVPDAGWWALVEELAPKKLAESSEIYVNAIRDDMTPAEARAWRKLHACLGGLRQSIGVPDRIDTFQKWVAPVARFSFKSGRLIGGAGSAPGN
ncbi:MAG TPA: P-loop NTPase fold protein [Thermoanaerobaculia bacterium]